MRRFTAIALAVPALAAVVSFVIPSYWLTLLIYIGINALVCLGLVVMTGYAGITSFGQAAFVGLGAYTTALLTAGLQLSPWLSLPASIALTMLLALAIGWITVRLSGHYLVLGTFAWSIGLYYVFANVEALGGYNGISGLPSLFLAPGRDERIALNVLIWGAVALAMLLTINILDSRAGRAIRAVRSRAMAESFGVDTARYKLAVFILAAAFAGTAGWLHAHFLRFVNPNPFHLNASVEYLFMAIIGGVSNLLGAIAGSLIVVVDQELAAGRDAGADQHHRKLRDRGLRRGGAVAAALRAQGGDGDHAALDRSCPRSLQTAAESELADPHPAGGRHHGAAGRGRRQEFRRPARARWRRLLGGGRGSGGAGRPQRRGQEHLVRHRQRAHSALFRRGRR